MRSADFREKVVIVTGASSGAGRAYALAFVEAGATVIALARTLGDLAPPAVKERGTLAEVVQAANALPGTLVPRRCDLRVEEEVVEAVAATIRDHHRIDVLVNNAAIFPHHPTLGTTVSQWDAMMELNARGTYLMIREVAPHMIAQRAGSIVNLSSGVAQFTTIDHPGHNDLLAYAVSKAAVNRLTTYVSEDFKEFDIAVNAISPGAVLSDNFRAGDPQVVARALDTGWGKEPTPEIMGPPVLHLAAQTARTFTGQIVHHDEFGITWGPGSDQ